MARVKKDHSGWRSHGIWKKYQEPAIKDAPVKPKSKKNTRKWCAGKVGREHKLYREYYYSGWSRKPIKSIIYTICSVCSKKFYRSKEDTSIPLEIPIDNIEDYTETWPVQVKVNGICLPIDSKWLRKDRCYCGEFH